VIEVVLVQQEGQYTLPDGSKGWQPLDFDRVYRVLNGKRYMVGILGRQPGAVFAPTVRIAAHEKGPITEAINAARAASGLTTDTQEATTNQPHPDAVAAAEQQNDEDEDE